MSGKLPTQTYHQIEKDKVGLEYLRNKLKLKHFKVKETFSKKHPHIGKILAKKGIELGKIREHSAKVLGAAGLTGTLLLTPPLTVKSLPAPSEILESLNLETTPESLIPQEILIKILSKFLPEKVRPLEKNEEKFLEQIFENIIGIKVRATLEGEHLNTTYGLIGAEQHLKRYPGDVLANHLPFLREGMAPGLGAWGYFAPSRSDLTLSLENTERWYAVVQTLYLPDWNIRQPYLRDWYKYRKVLIVNIENGNAVVTVIGDSGPAAWTGKHFGGSPETMEYLGGPRYKKGLVVIFFVDDPENRIPLGPVEYNKVNLPEVAMEKI